MNHKNSKFAQQILALQREDGTWGPYFHALGQPTGVREITTEQALRRLRILGFTLDDPPIGKAVDCMTACLLGSRKIDDYWEKTHDWALFTQLMLATWVKLFCPHNEPALEFSKRWARVIESAFAGGVYCHAAYLDAYSQAFSAKPRGGRELDFVDFYHVSLLQGVLTQETQGSMLDYILARPQGLYYIYGKPLHQPPTIFASKEASHYLAALEILARYVGAREKLGFALDWLQENRDANGQWDFGAKAKDGIYFPLSDSWQVSAQRKADCTERVTAFLEKLGG